MTTFKIKSDSKMRLPFRNLKIKCKPRNANIKISGIKAGNITMLSVILPSSNSFSARWLPHHGHSKPKYFL